MMNFQVGDTEVNVRFYHRRRHKDILVPGTKTENPSAKRVLDAFGGETMCSIRFKDKFDTFRGTSTCRSDTVFNKRIGNAFSLRRALKEAAKAGILPKDQREKLFKQLNEHFGVVNWINICKAQ